ncbi:Minus-end-directed kinesin ATPase protein [Dioscorea alata]|uniref:Minus-end-directed kinesin ATPase protein n=1 Tax=Dioscorea alata TaxID=55571 RepID=A0ACB7TRV1_DIOAL|nr:Minus-end-directed kinesin ATPase protein [Dioscorea alata]
MKRLAKGEAEEGATKAMDSPKGLAQSSSESSSQHELGSPVMPEPSSPFGHKSGYRSHLYAAKASDLMKSNNLDSSPTQTLLNVANSVLNESIERKNGEIPQIQNIKMVEKKKAEEQDLVKLTSEIEAKNHTISVLTKEKEDKDHIISLLKKEKELQDHIISVLKKEKEDKDHIISVLKKEKEDKDHMVSIAAKDKEEKEHLILKLKQEFESMKNSCMKQCQESESDAKETKLQLDNRIKELEILLADSRRKIEELELYSKSKSQTWNEKESTFLNSISFQQQVVQDLRVASKSIKQSIINTQLKWSDEVTGIGKQLKVLVNAAENYHAVLAENKKLFNEVQELKGNIRVYCRIRPFLPGENLKATIVDYIGDNGELLVANPSKQVKDKPRSFKFNKIFGPAASQAQVYLDIQPFIRSVLDGFNVCIFAYGQTGSGKTYTMSGPNPPSEEEWGVNYRALNDLFNISQSRKGVNLYEVGVQMVEIYNEQVRDLLSNEASQKRYPFMHFFLFASLSNGLAVPDANMLPVKSTSDVLELMQIGFANRAVGATALNSRSSRSHSVVTVHVRNEDLKTGSASQGSLHLIDLAGSERADRSEATGDRLKEAQHINKSLSALGDVIFALSQKSAHVPYRNSKLTQLLQRSLGGQAKTLMFVQVNPDVLSFSESLSTLKFAERVSGVELGAAKSSKEGKDVSDLIEQVASLKDTIARKDDEIEQLQQAKDTGNQSPGTSNGRKLGSITLQHSSSFPGKLSSSGSQKSLGGMVKRASRVSLDTDSYSECGEGLSESSSHNSLDELNQQFDTDFSGNGEAESDEKIDTATDKM